MQGKQEYPLLSLTSAAQWLAAHRPVFQRTQLLAGMRAMAPGLALWLVFILFLALVQFSTPDLPDNDGFYHIKLAYLMRTEGLKPEFTWLPLSILNPREFYDHHFLFHVALIPFTFGNLLTGAKLAAALFASLAFLSTWNLLKNQRVPYAALWALGLMAVSEAFIYRMSIPRAQSLSLAVLMVGLDWLLRKQHKRLVFLGFLYVWLYDAFPLLLIVSGVYAAASAIIDRKLDFYPVLYTSAGLALGLVINPYFPHNIVFAVQHILPKLLDATSVRVGNEWFPYETATLLKNSPLALASFAAGALGLGLSGRQMDIRTLFGFLLAVLFGFMLLQARRFIEYFPAFSLVFAAFAWAPLLESIAERGNGQLRRHLPALVLALVLIPGMVLTFRDAKASIGRSKPYQTYAGASAWLAANTPAGSRVFQTDWDDFPRLFYYNTHNTYLIGLDPTYLQIYDDNLYRQWVKIVQGDVDQPSSSITWDFGAQYVHTDLNHKDFIEQAGADSGLAEVYRDGDSVVYQVTAAR